MFFINMKSQNALTDCTSNSFKFPDAGYPKKEGATGNRFGWVCGGSPPQTYASLSAIADLRGFARTVYETPPFYFSVQSVVLFQLTYENMTII